MYLFQKNRIAGLHRKFNRSLLFKTIASFFFPKSFFFYLWKNKPYDINLIVIEEGLSVRKH